MLDFWPNLSLKVLIMFLSYNGRPKKEVLNKSDIGDDMVMWGGKSLGYEYQICKNT